MRVEYKGKNIDLHTQCMKQQRWTWWYSIDQGPLHQNMNELPTTDDAAAEQALSHAKRAIDSDMSAKTAAVGGRK